MSDNKARHLEDPAGPTEGRRVGAGMRILLSLVTLAPASCGKGGSDGAGPLRPEGPAATAPAAPMPEAGVVIRGLLDSFGEQVERYLASLAPHHLAAEQQLQGAGKARPGEAAVLRSAYVERRDGLRFAGPDGTTPAGTKLLEVLAAAEVHGLQPGKLLPAGLDELTIALSAAQQAFLGAPAIPPPTRQQAAALEQLLAGTGLRTDDPELGPQLIARLAGEAGPWPELRQALSERLRLFSARQQALAALELALADAFCGYARKMKHGNVRRELYAQERQLRAYKRAKEQSPKQRQPEPDDREAAGEPTEEEPAASPPAAPPVIRSPAELSRDKLLADLARITDAESCARVLDELVPDHPQYTGLQAELARYRQVAATGGFEQVKSRPCSLARGLARPLVLALKERLAAEGLYTGEIDGKLDAGLREAVRKYQQTHQMAIEPDLRPMFWSSLNVPVEERLARIEVSLQRWRESAIGDDPRYVFVNIADFSAEVWADGQRLFRTGVVVGNRDLRCDEKKKELVLGYATPIQSARISYLVFAPMWNVPPKIKREELDVEREKDLLYYQKNGYEVLEPGSPDESVRQLPGPENSLGFVKFVFPNPHAVFMHDTPTKGLFALPIRAFSHGCMRLEDPIGMARTLLTLDGQWDEQRYTELYEKWKEIDFVPLRTRYDAEAYEELRKRATKLEKGVTLKQPIPIHVEYYTVRVDAEGRANFLADPYGYDQQLLHPTRPKKCTPDSEKARVAFTRTLDELEKVETRLESTAAEGKRLLAAARGVDAGSPKKTARIKEAIRALEEAMQQSRTLADQVRALHGELQQQVVGPDEKAWNRKRTEQAMMLKRMMDELRKMEKRLEKRQTTLRDRLGPETGKEGKRPAQPGPVGAAAGAAAPAPGPESSRSAVGGEPAPAPPAGQPSPPKGSTQP